jgi:hypothetical protein
MRARASGQPVSALVRNAVELLLKGKESANLPAFTGVGASGDRQGSVRAEQLLRRRARRSRR